MKLMTKAIANQLPKLYETEDVPLPEKVAYAKFFYPENQWTWYPVEYDGKDRFFGLVVGQETELGYFSLEELSSFIGATGLSVERDLYFQPTKLQDLGAEG